MNDQEKETLYVDVDWSSTGLWSAKGNMSYERVDMPAWLRARFEFWTEWYNRWEPWNYEDDDPLSGKPDDELFDAYGLSLAIDLQRVLGASYDVHYMKTRKSANSVLAQLDIVREADPLTLSGE